MRRICAGSMSTRALTQTAVTAAPAKTDMKLRTALALVSTATETCYFMCVYCTLFLIPIT